MFVIYYNGKEIASFKTRREAKRYAKLLGYSKGSIYKVQKIQ